MEKRSLTVKQFKKLNGFDIPDSRWKLKNGQILCDKCGKNKALFEWYEPSKVWHRVMCDSCTKIVANLRVNRGGVYPEFVPESMKEKRKEYFNSMLQPTRGETISKEFVEAYPEKAHKIFKGEERNAQYVFSDIPGFSTRQRSR